MSVVTADRRLAFPAHTRPARFLHNQSRSGRRPGLA
jgi:hypothetical protein